MASCKKHKHVGQGRAIQRSLLMTFIFLVCVPVWAEEAVSLRQMIDRIMATYPSIEVAALQVERARQEVAKVKSTLGWQVFGQAGLAHDLSFIDSPTDRFDVSAGITRRLQSGSQIEFAGQYAYEDTSRAFSPLLPDPSHRTGLDIKYRLPLARGQDNVQYQQGLINAEAGIRLEQANQVLIIDTLIQQAIGIFFDAANAYQRLQDARAAVDRARRLQAYIERNYSLGLAEERDILGIEAQINGAVSRRDSIELSWRALRTEVNRLIGRPAGADIRLILAELVSYDQTARADLLAGVYGHSPVLEIQQARAEIAHANVTLTRDQRMQQLDLVLSAGARYASGDIPGGSYSQDELIGGARLEYRYDLDQRGFDAELYQNLLRYEAAKREQELLRHDLQYVLDRLLEQLESGRKSIQSHTRYVNLEQRKLEEAVQRYREGRATTRELIDFENDLNTSQFAYNNQRIELARVQANIQLLVGELWDLDRLSAQQARRIMGNAGE